MRLLDPKPGPSVPTVPGPQSRNSNEEHEMDFDDLRDFMDQDIPAGEIPTGAGGRTGPIAQFLNGMPDWMKMTPDDLNKALKNLSRSLQGTTSTRNITVRGHTGKSKARETL